MKFFFSNKVCEAMCWHAKEMSKHNVLNNTFRIIMSHLHLVIEQKILSMRTSRFCPLQQQPPTGILTMQLQTKYHFPYLDILLRPLTCLCYFLDWLLSSGKANNLSNFSRHCTILRKLEDTVKTPSPQPGVVELKFFNNPSFNWQGTTWSFCLGLDYDWLVIASIKNDQAGRVLVQPFFNQTQYICDLAHRIRCQAHCREILIISFSSSIFAASTRNFFGLPCGDEFES